MRACLLHRKLRLCGDGGVLGSFIGARDGMGLFSAAVYFRYGFAVTAMGEVHVPAAIGMELEVAMDLVVAAMGEVRRESVRVLYLYILTQSRRVGA